MSSSRILTRVWLAAMLAAAGTASAAEYLLAFAPLSEQFSPTLQENRRTLTAMLSLLHDYHGATGIHFVLAGDMPAQCAQRTDCPAWRLLQQRVRAVTSEIMAQPGATVFVRDLQWQPLATATPTARIEGVRLRLKIDDPALWSEHCQYRLQVADPRLPPALSATGEGPDWVDVRGLADIPLSAGASVRARIADSPGESGTITVRQRLSNHAVVLALGSGQAQWSARQVEWGDMGADIEIDAQLSSRDIGNVLLPWEDAPAKPASGASPGECRAHFVLAR